MSETTATGADVRVRFCPSPTGTPRVSMVRTCLFGWTYARHTGGTFVFRVEDTNAARDSQKSFNQITESPRWLSLDWDEGVDEEGPHSPYRQSERMDIYCGVVTRLLEASYAYESYPTPEETEERHRAKGEDPRLGYSGFDHNLTGEQIAAFRTEGRQPVLRLRVFGEDITFTDLICGRIIFKAGSAPDYVVVRANDHPLYTLADPIDDALMEIIRVLRDENLLSSTPHQIVLYRALEAIGAVKFILRFGHLPYVTGEGSKKLSKRDPESNLLLHKTAGMIPEGLNNYLALLGWSIAADRDIFFMEGMTQVFDILGMNPNPVCFDQKKAIVINAEQVHLLDGENFCNRLIPFLHRDEVISTDSFETLTDREYETLTEAVPLTQTHIQLLGEATGMLAFLFVTDDTLEIDEKAVSKLKDNTADVLGAAIETVEGLIGLAITALEGSLCARIASEVGVKPRLVFNLLCVAVTGRQVSPPLFEPVEILGRDSSLTRPCALRVSLA